MANLGKFLNSLKEYDINPKNASVLANLCIIIGTVLIIGTSVKDELGVMIHIWIAGFSAIAIFYLYYKLLLPTIMKKMNVTDSHFRANTYMIVLTYILGSASGAGLLTTVFNILGISAGILLIWPLLPRYYFASLYATMSILFGLLAILRAMKLAFSIPLAICFAGASAICFRKVYSVDADYEVNDIEGVCILTGKYKGSADDNATIWKIILKNSLSLTITAVASSVLFYWVMLSINPFWMRASKISKYETLHRLPHDVNLSVREVSSLNDLEYYKSKLDNHYPLVIKPSICTTNSRNVQKCADYKCLETFLKDRIENGPLNNKKNGNRGSWVIQEYTQSTEGVVFYYKLPYMSRGSIKNIGIREDSEKVIIKRGTSLTARYWPETFRTDFSQKYVDFFNDLASKIPGYYGGRFDIMLPPSFESELHDPRGTTVLELNVFFLGCIQEKSPHGIVDELKIIRTSLMQIYIGIVNIVAGYNFLNFWGIVMKVPELISRTMLCGNHEHLMAKP